MVSSPSRTTILNQSLASHHGFQIDPIHRDPTAGLRHQRFGLFFCLSAAVRWREPPPFWAQAMNCRVSWGGNVTWPVRCIENHISIMYINSMLIVFIIVYIIVCKYDSILWLTGWWLNHPSQLWTMFMYYIWWCDLCKIIGSNTSEQVSCTYEHLNTRSDFTNIRCIKFDEHHVDERWYDQIQSIIQSIMILCDTFNNVWSTLRP